MSSGLSLNRVFMYNVWRRGIAYKVGIRHGKPVIYKVHSGEMYRNGFKFFRSVNGVWLIKRVPSEYLERMA